MSLKSRIERLEGALEDWQERSAPVHLTPFEVWRRLLFVIERARSTGENIELAQRLVDGLELGPVTFPEPDPNYPMESVPGLPERLAAMLGLEYPPDGRAR